MSPRSFGENKAFALTLLAALALFAACEKKIPGEPGKIASEYIEAVKKGDFGAVYRLNRITARQMAHLKLSEAGDVELMLKQNYDDSLAEYERAPLTFTPGIQWAEKHYFPPSCEITAGEPQWLKPVGDDPVNVEYEKALTVTIPVAVTYKDKNSAPEMDGRKIKSASYTCSLGKIRFGKSVTVYDVDERWYFNGCIIDRDSVSYF